MENAIPDWSIVFKHKLAEKLEIDPSQLSITGKYTKIVNVGGFKGIWHLPMPQAQAIAMGSVFKVHSTEPIDLATLDNVSIGERIGEGFGHIGVNRHGLEEIQMAEISSPISPLENVLEPLQPALSYFLNRHVMQWVDERALSELEYGRETAQLLKKLVNSKASVSRLELMIKNARTFDMLTEHFNVLATLAKEKLETLKKVLYLKFGPDKIISIDHGAFECVITNSLNTRTPIQALHIFCENYPSVNLGADLSGENLYRLYQQYCITFLIGLKFKLRRKQ